MTPLELQLLQHSLAGAVTEGVSRRHWEMGSMGRGMLRRPRGGGCMGVNVGRNISADAQSRQMNRDSDGRADADVHMTLRINGAAVGTKLGQRRSNRSEALGGRGASTLHSEAQPRSQEVKWELQSPFCGGMCCGPRGGQASLESCKTTACARRSMLSCALP
eukprot:366178-Chlamydomonas_euryale.AAC.6